uniref:EGF-like domain-containing protein n=1 Tax=Panagrolaimus superbus TaxID=310955 RepID=A0A914YAA1_9BILA
MDGLNSDLPSLSTPTPDIGGMTSIPTSNEIGSPSLIPSTPAPMETNASANDEMAKIDPVPYDIMMENKPPSPIVSAEETAPHALSPLTLEATEIPTHLSTCNIMNGSQFDEKLAAGACIASCKFQDCGTGHCEMRGDQPTCVCGRCDKGSGVKCNINVNIGK